MNTETNLIQAAPAFELDSETLEKLIVSGDLSKLTTPQRLLFYRARCEAAGLDYRTQPFEYITLQGKLTLYARKAASDQLAALHGARCKIVARETADDIHSVIVEVAFRDGRSTEDIGCVNVKGLAGEPLANARMKAVTKGKRRAILSLAGLGMNDELEIDDIPAADRATPPPRDLDALVLQGQPQTAPVAAEDAVQIRTLCGLTVVLGAPWDEWHDEVIGGANPVLGPLTWTALLGTSAPAVVAEAEKALETGRKQEYKTGAVCPERFQRLAVVMHMRQQDKDMAALKKEAETVL